MQRSFSLIVIAVLAVAQGVLGILRAFDWFRIGADLVGQGILILPLMGFVAFARGGFVIVFALLYMVFALGALLHKDWAWWLGFVVSGVNGLLVLSVAIEGETLGRALFWLIVPVVVVWYLLSAQGRQVLKS